MMEGTCPSQDSAVCICAQWVAQSPSWSECLMQSLVLQQTWDKCLSLWWFLSFSSSPLTPPPPLSLSLSPFLPSSPLFSPVSPAPSLPCSLVNILCKDLGPNRSRNVLVARWKPITLETILYKALLSNRNMQSHIQNFTFLISHNKKVQKEQIEIVLVIYFCLPRYIQNIISMGNQYKKHINEIFSFLFSHKMLKI